MKAFLEKLKLIDHLTTELEIQKDTFVSKLKASVDEGDTGLFFNTFEAFSSSKNEYKGHVGSDGFKIRRRRRLFDMNINLAVAQGTYKQTDNHLIIETEINSYGSMIIPIYAILLVFYAIFIISFFTADNVEGIMSGFALLFILMHAAFMFGIPYFMMRRSVSKLKYQLEREFHYLTK
jgi:hypothetical protein